ncbi:hypothetical protein M3Y99_01598100 [Aphelenchoides fujianensis]|nr:hypothetical protein M3Y99_01598100 [Aphelenchoides fujianensis]
MRTLMRVLLYRRNCTRAGVRQEELAASLRCVISANIGACEVQRPLNRKMLDCSLKSPSLIDESNLFNRLAAELHVGRFEVCRFLNGFFLHLHYLEALVPAAPLVEDAAQFGRFLAAVVAESDRGAFVTLTESLGLEPTPANLRLLAAWNREFEAAEGNRTRRSALLPAFLRTTAELSALSTRMANETPPALLDALVGRVLREAADAAPPVLRARVRVEPRCLREGGRLRVVLELENPTADVPLDALELRLGFTALNSTLRAIVGVGFRLADGRRWHEVQSAAFRVAPAVRLRTFAFLHANVPTAGLPAAAPFSALLLVMNVGYATARDVRLVGLRPEVVDALDGRPLPFALEAAAVDGEPRAAAHQLALGDLQSGESRRVALNLTTSAPSEVAEEVKQPSTFGTPYYRHIDGLQVRQVCKTR